MSIYGWIWFAIFGVACPIAVATTVFYGAPLTVLLSLCIIPPAYLFARRMFWSPWGP